MGKSKKVSLTEELRAASLAASKAQKQAKATKEEAERRQETERRAKLPGWAQSYFKDYVLPRLQEAAHKGEESCYLSETGELGYHESVALLEVLRENGLETSLRREKRERNPHSEFPGPEYEVMVISVKIR